ncbi:bifunctional 3-(3-hydroxy-phenyl)propionate/3-hydroxycinnamic acid hydroxylase MhpA [Caulobacter hibisci]|uniref:Bifunctional 3-(3-hydroxy-phenyl)propionate/3-hydroxycinnamic acid hydroxylase n=1 Tax=Caulobacter hibisci TaxID=2035993 RepID=A0ABS0SXK2_9CAUL|nr:bifunctional 3-(3-hydroxy-phenyl)propionate/3-hydroxycinnamic acid hydroxylase [Caulobacter hibisci]MBI1683640.1 bifunctional 3-(3-hydroxy-phenyl)propionate/3-hydroxycinnamic acid hydroxylase [Caulobacter hibisci]
MTYDVAIVGCGPVGALAANLLGQAGLSVLVLEQERDPHPLPRAVHLDHEMMRIFQGAGLVDRLHPLMRETQGHLHIGADGGVIRYMGTAGQAKRFGWANDYFFYQPELEAQLRDALARFPAVTLRLGAKLESLTQDDAGADLVLAGGETLRARWVIACDGARSAVRKSLGVKLDDLDFEEPWLVVDAEVDGPIVFPDIPGLPAGADLQQLSVMLCDPRRPATIVPGRGNHRRWEFMLLPGEDDQAMMATEQVEALIAPWVEGSTYRLVRAATYRFHGLVAERWRVGRVFLAGDAAHQTPPFFGQGMCHGLRDVSNLAWKLPLVIAGLANEALLDTYQPERDPHVRGVIGAAVNAGRYICQLDPAKAAERDAHMREVMAAAKPGTTAADLIPAYQAGVARPGSGERFIHPRVGGVLLDDVLGEGFAVIAREPVASSPAFAHIGGSIHVIGQGLDDADGALAAWLDAKGAAAVLLRPDRYVYGVAETADALPALIDQLRADLSLKVAAPEETACPV